MNTISILTIAAIILGPIFSIVISGIMMEHFARKRIKLDRKFAILSTIIMHQWKGTTEDEAKALNLIDLVFYDVPNVRDKWHQYFESLHVEGKPNEATMKLWKSKKLELVQEMASDIGYSHTISPIDLDRMYMPVGLSPDILKDPQKIDEIIKWLTDMRNELVLKQTNQLKNQI